MRVFSVSFCVRCVGWYHSPLSISVIHIIVQRCSPELGACTSCCLCRCHSWHISCSSEDARRSSARVPPAVFAVAIIGTYFVVQRMLAGARCVHFSAVFAFAVVGTYIIVQKMLAGAGCVRCRYLGRLLAMNFDSFFPCRWIRLVDARPPTCKRRSAAVNAGQLPACLTHSLTHYRSPSGRPPLCK